MRVLHVVEYLKLGGIERFLDNFSAQLPQDTFILAFEMARPEGVSLEMMRQGRQVFLMKKEAGHDHQVAKRIRSICRENGISVVHTHDFGAMEYAVEAKMFQPGLKLVHTQHTLHHFVSNPKYVHAYNLFGLFYHALTNVSESVRETIQKRVYGLDAKLVVVPNGVVVPALLAESQSSQDRLELVGVSRLSPEKNIEATLQALALIKRPVRYTHLGDGDPAYKKQLFDLVETLGVASKVNFVGYTSDVSGGLSKADLFISSSKEEGMPLSVLEAMGHGLPCFLSDIPAHREIQQEGVVLVGKTVSELAQAVEGYQTVSNHQTLKKKISQFVKDHFSVEKMVQDYNQIYRVAYESC